MLLLRKVILAEALTTIGAMSQRLFVAFVASSRGSDEVVTAFLLSRRFSFYISHWMMSLCIVFSDLLLERDAPVFLTPHRFAVRKRREKGLRAVGRRPTARRPFSLDTPPAA